MPPIHPRARTTPEVRREIANSPLSVRALARKFSLNEGTIRKWRSRDTFEDRSHTPHRLQTTLNSAQEQVIVALRQFLLLPLDDLLAVVREFLNDKASRSGLSRCLTRHGVGNLSQLKEKESSPKHKPFKPYVPGYMYVDIQYLPPKQDEKQRQGGKIQRSHQRQAENPSFQFQPRL